MATKTPFTRRTRPGQRTIEWVLPTHDMLERALDILREVIDADEACDVGRRQNAIAELTSLPGYPLHQPGDRVEMTVRRPIIVMPTAKETHSVRN